MYVTARRNFRSTLAALPTRAPPRSWRRHVASPALAAALTPRARYASDDRDSTGETRCIDVTEQGAFGRLGYVSWRGMSLQRPMTSNGRTSYERHKLTVSPAEQGRLFNIGF